MESTLITNNLNKMLHESCHGRTLFELSVTNISCTYIAQWATRIYYHFSSRPMLISIKMPSVLWQCWVGAMKSTRLVKIEWWGVGVVICLEQGADYLHIIQLTPLHPKTPSCLALFKSRLVLPVWYQLTQVVLEKGRYTGVVAVVNLHSKRPL